MPNYNAIARDSKRVLCLLGFRWIKVTIRDACASQKPHDQQERAPCQEREQSRAQQGCRPLQALPCQRGAPGRCAFRDARCAEGARQAPALRLPAQVSAPADGRGQREPVQAAVQSLAGRFPSVYSPAGLPCLSANMNSLCSPCAGGGATSMPQRRSSSTSPTSGRGPRRSPR